jgi:acyl-lipid Delta6-acetylenase / acyl-lipid (9-3)-desaturase
MVHFFLPQGGLNYQVEHHLFPTMPRHNLYKCSKHVKEFCIKYEIPYQVESWWVCLKEVENQLASVAAKVQDYYPMWEAEDAARAKKAQ